MYIGALGIPLKNRLRRFLSFFHLSPSLKKDLLCAGDYMENTQNVLMGTVAVSAEHMHPLSFLPGLSSLP